ncbi:RagB/SusD family nutrient uptake outer membrane protein [Zobellia sp.]|nr:RagB/SusD family nutrient uptake outer membrane protein [Zobellia sp.]
MKNILYYTLFTMLLGLTSCSDELELEPKSELSLDSFYTTESDFELALNGTYIADIHSDNTVPQSSGSITTRREFNDFNIAVDNSEINTRWNNSYLTIARANAILDRISEADIESATKNRITGEAQFIRGLVYFNLVRIYGSIPLVLQEIPAAEALELPQSSTGDIYAQIVLDLTSAANLLPTSHSAASLGKATSISANAILGKVYLTIQNYPQVITTLANVTALEGGEVDLLDSYAAVFDTANEMNQEILFALRWTNDGVNGNAFNFDYTQVLQPSNLGTADLLAAFETNDVRRDLTLNTVAKPDDILVYKFGVGENGRGESDWPVIRYADVLLMIAEALNEEGYSPTGEAFTLLNRIRARAGLNPLTSTEVPDQNSFRLAIEQERRVELASEGHRWFDLVRTNRFIDVLTPKGFPVQEFHAVFPIPETEILKINDASVLAQNPNY